MNKLLRKRLYRIVLVTSAVGAILTVGGAGWGWA